MAYEQGERRAATFDGWRDENDPGGRAVQQVKPQKYAQALFEMGVPADTVRAFFKWGYDNLETWKRFEAEALRQARGGRKNWGAKACAEAIRFNEAGLYVRGDYRIPNQWIAYLGRVFAIKWPEYADLFTFKEIKGVKQAA